MNEITNSSTSLDIERTPHIIATEIYGIKGQVRSVVLLSSVEIGQRLVEAKSMLAHGEWGEWLKNSVQYSKSTANNLMQIYKEYGPDTGKFPSMIGNLNYTQAIALLGVPEEERESFVKENDIDNMTTRELQKAIKEKQQLEDELKSAKEVVVKAMADTVKFRDEKFKIESELRTNREVLRGAQNDYKALESALAKEKENLKKVKENQKEEIAKLQSFIGEAKVSGDGEEVERLQASLQELQKDVDSSALKIDELETQLKEKPVDVTETIIEKVPEEIEKELQELRKKDSQNSDQIVIKFKRYYENLQNTFKAQLELIDEIKETNPENHEKFKNAISNLISKMGERL